MGLQDTKISIDMVRLSFNCDPDVFIRWVQPYWLANSTQGEFFESFKFMKYRYQWTFMSGKSSLTLLYQLNSDKMAGKWQGAIEWNPNKVDLKSDSKLWDFIKYILMFSRSFELKSVDVAYDLYGVRISQCCLSMGKKGIWRALMGHKGALTMYAGARGSAGSTKLYDKRQELIDSGHDDPMTMITRYEVTFKSDISFIRLGGKTDFIGSLAACSVPDLIVMHDVNDFDLDIEPETLLILEGLRHLPHLYNQLSKYKRKQIKDLQCTTTISPDLGKADSLCKEWFSRFYKDIIS